MQGTDKEISEEERKGGKKEKWRWTIKEDSYRSEGKKKDTGLGSGIWACVVFLVRTPGGAIPLPALGQTKSAVRS
jgi:hypothetical protein